MLYKGIFLPSLTNSFHNKQLETSYLLYSNRQRQKSLITLNIVDLGLKVSKKQRKKINTNKSHLKKIIRDIMQLNKIKYGSYRESFSFYLESLSEKLASYNFTCFTNLNCAMC